MFRMANDGIIASEYIDAWAQNVHLAFVTNADDHERNQNSIDHDQDGINFIKDEVDETTFSHYVSTFLQAHRNVSDN